MKSKNNKKKNQKIPVKIKRELESLTKKWIKNNKKKKNINNVDKFIKTLKKKCKKIYIN